MSRWHVAWRHAGEEYHAEVEASADAEPLGVVDRALAAHYGRGHRLACDRMDMLVGQLVRPGPSGLGGMRGTDLLGRITVTGCRCE